MSQTSYLTALPRIKKGACCWIRTVRPASGLLTKPSCPSVSAHKLVAISANAPLNINSWRTPMQISECKLCKNTFNKRLDSKGIYCSNPCRLEGSRLDRIERNKLQKIQNESRYNENPTFCQQCHLVLTYINRTNKFCSHSCAASHHNARRGPMRSDQREKLRKIVTEYHKNNPKERKLPKTHELVCMVCSSVFQSKNPRKTCSFECLKANSSRIGRNNSSRRQSRSRDEIELYRLCNDITTRMYRITPL
jgi:hypothetical protein